MPKGSFYFYFKSKDDLGLALIDYYAEFFSSMSESSLRSAEGSPLQRLEKFFEDFASSASKRTGRVDAPLAT